MDKSHIYLHLKFANTKCLKKLTFLIQIFRPAFTLHRKTSRVMGRLLFLAVSKWNLLFIIVKDDGKRWEHLFFFISGREEAAIQPSTHTRVRTHSRASHISVSLPSVAGLYLCYNDTFSLTRVDTPHLSFMTNLSVVVGVRLYSGCRNSFLNSIMFLWMIHVFFFFLNARHTWPGFVIWGTCHILVLMILW